MNPKQKINSVEDWLLEDALDPAVTKEQIHSELRAAGVNIDSILQKASSLVGDKVREHYRTCAAAGSEMRTQSLSEALRQFADWPIERVRNWLQEVADGHQGPAFQALAQPCFRNRSSAEMTEEEIRNLAAEVKATMNGEHGGKSL